MFLEVKIRLSAADHELAELGLVLLMFGLISLWLHVNQPARVCEACDEVAPSMSRRIVSRTPGYAAVGGSAGEDPRERDLGSCDTGRGETVGCTTRWDWDW